MISPKARAVYLKELRDALRDRRTIFASIVIPLLLYPVMLLLTAEVSQIARAKLEREVHVVAVPQGSAEFFSSLNAVPKDEPKEAENKKEDPAAALRKMQGASMEEKMGKAPTPKLTFAEMTETQAETALAAGSIRAYVLMPDNIKDVVAAETNTKVEIRYDQAEQRSRDASDRVQTMLERYEQTIIKERLEKRNLSPDSIRPFKPVSYTHLTLPTNREV